MEGATKVQDEGTLHLEERPKVESEFVPFVQAAAQQEDCVIDAPTYLSCQHKQSDEEDEERDAAHSLQVFQNTRPQRSESNGYMWGGEAGGDEKDRRQIRGDVTGVERENDGDVGQRTFH